MDVRVNQTFGQGGGLKSEEAEPTGVYLFLQGGVVGYSEATDTAPDAVDIGINGSTESVQMQEHADYPSVSVAETTLPGDRPLRTTVQGVTEYVYRLSSIPDGADRFHDVGGDYDVILTDDAHLRMRQHSSSLANAFNAGAAWGDIQAIIPDSVSDRIIKQDLVGYVKKKYSEMSEVPQGFVVSHDNGTTKGLWGAQAATTAEPTKDSADWSLVIEVTV